MTRRTRIVLGIAAALLLAAPAAGEESPAELLAAWQTAIAEEDHAAYLACLHSQAREVPTYGAREAMAFWATQLEELRAQGFSGEFSFEAIVEGDARAPTGALRARPIVGGQPHREAILLIREAGRWTIARLFS